ncbi:unnamed protein product [Phytomonas sp. Hart1]|nr:unnamed protein product [Phytomonas sp. Hart1]|eukprot:CCW68109.1 unnamed protein product [Phytomonas sp. isolate Hart1]
MLATSLILHSPLDAAAFPLLAIRSCISEAYDSRNGPRFCAQDRHTGAVYEARCAPLHTTTAAPARRHRERAETLLSVSERPRCVALPIDAYLYESPSGAAYVAAVEAFAGLSLGDLVRSGWDSMEERVFVEILEVVAEFGCASCTLPPHGNLSADAIWQLLTPRDGASEASNQSRWVVGDWLLTYDPDNVTFDAASVIGDLEFMLHSAFSQLNIISSGSGVFLSHIQVEQRIDQTVEQIRNTLFTLSIDNLTLQPTGRSICTGETGSEALEMVTLSLSASALSGVGMNTQADDPIEESLSMSVPESPLGSKFLGSTPNSPSAGSTRDVLNFVCRLSLRDKINFHQNELRQEQQLANRYRRRRAMLPPLPRSNSYYTSLLEGYNLKENEPYEIQPRSPIAKLTPSLLLTDPPTDSVSDPHCLDTTRSKGQGKKQNGRNTKPKDRPLEPKKSSPKSIHKTYTDEWAKDRDALLQDVINTMLLMQQLRLYQAKARDQGRNHLHNSLQDTKVISVGSDNNYHSFFRNDDPFVNSYFTKSSGTDLEPPTMYSRLPYQCTSAFYARRDLEKFLSRKSPLTASTEPNKNRRRHLNSACPTPMRRVGRGRASSSHASTESPVLAQHWSMPSSQPSTPLYLEIQHKQSNGTDFGSAVNSRVRTPSRSGPSLLNIAQGRHSKALPKSTVAIGTSHPSSLKITEPMSTLPFELTPKVRPVIQRLPLEDILIHEVSRQHQLAISERIPPQHITRVPETATEVSGNLWGTMRLRTPQSARSPMFSSFPCFASMNTKTPRGYWSTLSSRSYNDFANDFFSADKGGGFLTSRDGNPHLLSHARLSSANTATVSGRNMSVPACASPHLIHLRGTELNGYEGCNPRLSTMDRTQPLETKSTRWNSRRSQSVLGFTASSRRVQTPLSAEGRCRSASQIRGADTLNIGVGASQDNKDVKDGTIVPGDRFQLYGTPGKLLLSRVRSYHGTSIKTIRVRRASGVVSEEC